MFLMFIRDKIYFIRTKFSQNKFFNKKEKEKKDNKHTQINKFQGPIVDISLNESIMILNSIFCFKLFIHLFIFYMLNQMLHQIMTT